MARYIINALLDFLIMVFLVCSVHVDRSYRHAASSRSLVPSPPPIQWWVLELELRSSEKRILDTGNWLNDCHISASHRLLQQQFPQIGGLQPPVLGSKLQFSVLHSKSVQILNCNKHWICISTIGCSPGRSMTASSHTLRCLQFTRFVI